MPPEVFYALLHNSHERHNAGCRVRRAVWARGMHVALCVALVSNRETMCWFLKASYGCHPVLSAQGGCECKLNLIAWHPASG